MKKRILGLFLTLLMILSLVPVSVTAEEAWMSFYVSPSGNDNASGTKDAPFKTLQRAQEEVRKYNKNMQGDITVNLMPGRYELTEQWELRQSDSGFNGYDVIWQGTDPNNLPVISGAKEVSGAWEEGENGIWYTKAEDLDMVRELFINGRIATRARSTKKIYGGPYYTEEVSYDFRHPKLGEQTVRHLGFYAEKSKIGLWENPEDIELHWTAIFRQAMFHVKDIIQDPKNEERVIVLLDNYWNNYRVLNTEQIIPERGFVVENAYELLDEPGEFYFNKKTKVLSYIPRDGEDLNNAEILIPRIEQLMYMHGGNIDNLMQNIRFKNVQFSHATSFEMEDGNVVGGQAEYAYTSDLVEQSGKVAINVDWAKNVAFEACVFYGISPTCLCYRNGVYESEVTGCVFTEIGGTGFFGGSIRHSEIVPHKETEGPSDAAFQAAYTASSHLQIPGDYSVKLLGTSRDYDWVKARGAGWYSDPFIVEDNVMPWIKIEMLSRVKIESIEFSFPQNATEEERSNFEVLVSNDRYFKDSKTVATFTDPAEFNVKLDMNDDETYRYVMLRKTKVEPFCLNGFSAWSYDVMPQGNEGLTKNNRVTNNYFTRVAQQKYGCYAVFLSYTRDYDIMHNTIYDTPYSSIHVGWGWYYLYNTTAGGNRVNYNRIDYTTNLMNDGGGVYMFGQQFNSDRNSEIKGNYISHAMSGWGKGVYLDSGNCGIDVTDNVFVDVRRNVAKGSSWGRTTVKNNWAADASTLELAQRPEMLEHLATCYTEEAQQFDFSAPPEEAVRIMAESGIEDEWLWILDRVSEKDPAQRILLVGLDAADSEVIKGKQGMIPGYGIEDEEKTAKYLLNDVNYGTLPWNFKPESKVAIAKAQKELDEFPTRAGDYAQGHLEEQEHLKEAIRNAYNKVVHPSYDEMVTMCNDFAKTASTKQYPEKAIETFKKEVAEITSQKAESRADYAVLAIRLEKAYSKLYGQSMLPELEAVVVENANIVFDRENRKVSVYLPFGVEPSEVEATYFARSGSSLVRDAKELDYSTGTVYLPICNENSKQFADWTIEFVPYQGELASGKVSTNPADWTGGNVNTTFQNVDGALNIEPWFQPSMMKTPMEGHYSFSLWALQEDTYNGYGIIFNAQGSNIEERTYEAKNSYYMLDIDGQTLTLYETVNGERVEHMHVDNVDFLYGQYNTFEISTQVQNGINRITVIMNGKKVIDTLVKDSVGAGGHFGIISRNLLVKVK